MCGIIAGVSDEDISPTLLEGLRRVEYRGYDSAGVGLLHGDEIVVRKDVGRVAELESKYALSEMHGTTGLAHTRWATHGGVTLENAHPHLSCHGEVAIVHNGIISNFLQLKRRLAEQGHRFSSETDSEVIAHLVEEEYDGDPVKATLGAARELRGQYAFVVLFRDQPETLTAARNDAPLIAGLAEKKKFLASDALAFISKTDRAVFVDNMEVVALTPRGLEAYDMEGRKVAKAVTQLAWELGEVSKKSYAHYTLKEIHEQPDSIQRAMTQEASKLESFASAIRNAGSVIFAASGSSYHAALVLRSRMTREARIRCDAIIAGEFQSESEFVDGGTVVIAISQSGETADLLNAVKLAGRKGARILSIVNAAGSSLARASDETLLLKCGPEVGVAATKSFTSQLMVGNLLVDALTGEDTAGEQKEASRLVEQALRSEPEVRKVARLFSGSPDFYFTARGHHYPIALEGALKLKELSYVHAEGIPASELKHGTLALIEKGTPVVVIAPSGDGYDDTISNAEELRARGAEVVGISDAPNEVFGHFVKVPRTRASLAPLLEVVPLQLLAYYAATERKRDPDYPRNLAKSVTVR